MDVFATTKHPELVSEVSRCSLSLLPCIVSLSYGKPLCPTSAFSNGFDREKEVPASASSSVTGSTRWRTCLPDKRARISLSVVPRLRAASHSALERFCIFTITSVQRVSPKQVFLHTEVSRWKNDFFRMEHVYTPCENHLPESPPATLLMLREQKKIELGSRRE